MKTPAKARGFTLVELLTVIAIVGVLATLVVPITGQVRETAKRSKCLSNVRQLGLGLISAANQNKSLAFPENNNPGAWAWDVSHTVVKDIVSQAGREVLYCPASTMVDRYSVDRLYDFYQGQAALTSYVLLIPGTRQVFNGWTAANPVPDYLNERIQANYNSGSYVIPASQRPLVVDAVISNGNDFTHIAGALSESVSNHMTGSLPVGGHTAYVDGHVKWRKFQRSTSASQAANPDYFTPKTAGTPSFWF